MTITIYPGYTPDYVIFKTTDISPEAKIFERYWGKITVLKEDIYKMMKDVTEYVYTELGENCVFEV